MIPAAKKLKKTLLLGQPKALAAAMKVNGKSCRRVYCQWQFSSVEGEAAVCMDDFCGRMGRKVVLISSGFRKELKISPERILGGQEENIETYSWLSCFIHMLIANLYRSYGKGTEKETKIVLDESSSIFAQWKIG